MLVVFSLVILSVVPLVASAQIALDECEAPMAMEFDQMIRRDSSIESQGAYAFLDFIEEPSCLSKNAICESKSYHMREAPGYYEEHYIYTIVVNGRVVFASTSEYYEGTYGSRLGSPMAEIDLDRALAELYGNGTCSKL